MHICYATIDYHGQTGGGGIASYVSTLGSELVSRGHQVTVLARGARPAVTEDRGMRVVFTPLGDLHWYLNKLRALSPAVLPVRELEWSWAIRRAVERLHAVTPIDIVEGAEAGVYFLTDSRRRLPALIVRLHGDRYSFTKYSGQAIPLGVRMNRRFTQQALRRAGGVSAPSRFQARDHARSLRWRVERIPVVPNPVSPGVLELAARHDARTQPGQEADMVLYAGRLEYCKGIIPLLQSVRSVADAVPTVQYMIAGGQHDSVGAGRLRQLIDRECIGGHVALLGHVPWPQLIDIYRRAAIFVMPSFYESFGISILEAMAFGLPVIATRAGGIPEVVEDGRTGFLVSPGDPQALAEATIELLRSPDLRRQMGRAGRERVLAKFTVGHVASQMLAVYQQTLEAARPCAS